MQRRPAPIAFIFAILALTPACDDNGARLADILKLDASAADGGSYFAQNCVSCHGADGGGTTGPNIMGRDADVVVEAALAGPKSMPSFSSASDQELADVAAFVSEL